MMERGGSRLRERNETISYYYYYYYYYYIIISLYTSGIPYIIIIFLQAFIIIIIFYESNDLSHTTSLNIIMYETRFFFNDQLVVKNYMYLK